MYDNDDGLGKYYFFSFLPHLKILVRRHWSYRVRPCCVRVGRFGRVKRSIRRDRSHRVRFTASRPGHMRLDHHVRPEDRGGLHDAVHDAGHKHTVRETGEEETATVLVLEPAVVQRVDVHGHGVPGRLAALVHVRQVKRGEKEKKNKKTRVRKRTL